MKFLSKLVLLLILCGLISCSNKQKEVSKIKEINQEMEMITAYKEGVENLEDNQFYAAAQKFLEAELLYPQDEWAPKSALMAAYSYYLQDYYSEATSNLERYLKTYPKDKRLPYAHFLLAICYYESIANEKRDLEPLLLAKDKFSFIVATYPNTDFALDSRFKIDLINDILASKEMHIGRHYLKKEKWIAAINRFKNVLNEYETTIYVEEAIHRLVEIHYRLGLKGEAKKYATLLGYNYQSGKWYEKSYKVFNKNFKIEKIRNNKKEEKKGMIKKFKKLFE